MSLEVSITRRGWLHVAAVGGESSDSGASGGASAVDRRILAAFAGDAGGESHAGDRGLGRGLMHLAIGELQTPLEPPLAFARELAREYLTRLCHTAPPGEEMAGGAAAESAPARAVAWKSPAVPAREELAFRVMQAPPMKGLEYLTAEALAEWWEALDRATEQQARAHAGGLQGFLRESSPVWRLVGRVTFHLAENKRDPEHPFAFLATYATRVSAQARVQHQPLGAALRAYGSAQDRERLIALLSPIQRAAEKSPWVKQLVDAGDIYHPLAWGPEEAHAFLQSLPTLEESGILVRVPDWWKAQRPPRPVVSVRVGQAAQSRLGVEALLDFKAGVTLEGEQLSESELRALLSATHGLVMLKGKWVEVDRDKLQAALAQWKVAEAAAREGSVSFLEGMRMLSGVNLGDGAAEVAGEAAVERNWSEVTAGDWLENTLKTLRGMEAMESPEAGRTTKGLKAELRPYQRVGVAWLEFMTRLGLGACLADDMGLGKTVQVLGLLLRLRESGGAGDAGTRGATVGEAGGASLLVVPASLLGNWKAELQRFAPSLRYFIAHPSEADEEQLNAAAGAAGAAKPGAADDCDLIITTYSMLVRLEWLRARPWNLVILDEAQAIKNAGTRQARVVKQLPARGRVAMTGTPVENRLSDLWSLFDFINPGLLGNAAEFGRAVKRIQRGEAGGYAPLRALVKPYILRRLKTDKRVIADLPEKTEVRAYCTLSKAQAALYAQAVRDLAEQLEPADGIQRRGIVLAYLMRFKQICNHPSQLLGDGVFDAAASGKFARLGELCAEMAERQERVLVFTQFREMTGPLADYLSGVFGRPGLLLHGGTAVGKRRELVEAFQREEGPPFFVLSLKAGGTGLNLTAASQVIHFDRWWNPAVENQATDRAFRIGQKKNVLVHKFVCRGTLEERIDEMIGDKGKLSREILETGGAEKLLTEMKNEELLRFVSLDIHRADAV